MQLLLGLEDFGKCLAGSYSKGVSEEPHLLHIVVLLQPLDMRLNVLGSVEFQALALEREDLGVRHGLWSEAAKIWYVGSGNIPR